MGRRRVDSGGSSGDVVRSNIRRITIVGTPDFRRRRGVGEL